MNLRLIHSTGSVTVAIYDGGPPGVLYEFIAVSMFYWLIAASIAELASAMPSAGGVYHWASITAGRQGKIAGFFAGYWNFLAWIFGLAATAQIAAAQVVSMYAAFHPAFVTQRWHVFVAYLIFTWISCFLVLFANKLLPMLESIGGFLIISGVFITIVVCASMPDVHATNDFVWRDWQNSTGYTSNGFVFLLGMLNGAFAVGTPDVVSHLAEEIPRYSFSPSSDRRACSSLTPHQANQKYSQSHSGTIRSRLHQLFRLSHLSLLQHLRSQ